MQFTAQAFQHVTACVLADCSIQGRHSACSLQKVYNSLLITIITPNAHNFNFEMYIVCYSIRSVIYIELGTGGNGIGAGFRAGRKEEYSSQ